MTKNSKEQIIIDGVVVSDCKDIYCGTNCGNTGASCPDIKCKNNPNCYFKQLARKSQECEELREDYAELEHRHNEAFQDFERIKQKYEHLQEKYEALKLENEEGYEIVDELKHECEELKEENQKLEMQLCNDCGERDDYNIPCKMIRDLGYGLQKEIEENDRYRKALEEIEEYAKENDEMLQGYHHEWANNRQILEIINKAKGGE